MLARPAELSVVAFPRDEGESADGSLSSLLVAVEEVHGERQTLGEQGE